MNTIKNKLSIWHTFIVLLLIVSCTEPQSELASYGPIFENVMISENGVFRGLSLGNSIDTVLSIEKSTAMEADEGYLYYEFSVDSSASYNIAYTFDEIGLSEIQSDIFINQSEQTEEVYNAFKSYFDKHYGTSQDHQGFAVWSVSSKKYGTVRINLSNESADFTIEDSPGKISLWIYPEKG
ncbi:MAG: hypothetical protein JNL69_06965 [Bacteroidia bacterium]|nr:hypothetical protein [Bacteroidia bacterium]